MYEITMEVWHSVRQSYDTISNGLSDNLRDTKKAHHAA